MKGVQMVTIHKITKRRQGKARVTFMMPAMPDCGCLYLVGNFDEWPESVYRMNCAEDGTWTLTLELEVGHEYQYRFRTLDGRWLSDASLLPKPSPFPSGTLSVNTLAVSPLSN
jgi:1,4-alpha-glucan branching enzyme